MNAANRNRNVDRDLIILIVVVRKIASVAQLAELLICNQPVVGSSPSAGSSEHDIEKVELIWELKTYITIKISMN